MAVSVQSQREPLDLEVITSFPYPIARAWSAYLEESDPRLRCKNLIDTFTAVLKYWSIIIASEYLFSQIDEARRHWQEAYEVRSELKDLRLEAQSLGLIAMTVFGAEREDRGSASSALRNSDGVGS